MSVWKISPVLFGVAAVMGGSRLAAAPAVMQLALPESEVAQIPTHPSLAVLLEFPSAITDYAGRGFTEEPAAVAGDFFLRWGAGDSYLAVSPLVEGARGVLHVVTGGRSYAVAFFPAPADQAWAKVSFVPATAVAVTDAMRVGRVPVTRQRHAEREPAASRDPRQWKGALDLLRLTLSLPRAQQDELLRANPALSFRMLEDTQLVAGGRLTVRAVLRNDILDTTSLAFGLENTGTTTAYWPAESLRVRVGDHVFTPVLSVVEGRLAPGERSEGLLVLAGDGAGGRHRLTVQNDFRISLAEAHPIKPPARPAP